MNETDVTVQETPGVIAPEDALLLQESDAPKIPAILLVDLSSIAHPIWHTSQAEPDPNHTSQRTAAVVRNLAAKHPHTAICCDSKSSFRKELDSTYKAQRPAQEAPLYHQIDLAKEALAADGFPVYEVDGFEGDDLIATATKQLREMVTPDHSVLIASADKDLLALVSDRVEVHSTHTGKRLGPEEVKAKLGVSPSNVVNYLTLVGDAADNIKGAKGIGPKTAAEILSFFGSLEGVYSAIDVGSASRLKPAQLASLKELRPRLETVQALVRMRTDVPLDIDAVFQPRVPKVVETFMEDDEMENEAVPAPAEFLARSLETAAVPPDEPTQEAAVYVAATGALDTAKDIGLATKPDTAVAVVEQPAPDEWERHLEPRSMHEACLLAKRLHASHMFDGYGSPQGVLSTVMLGRELGMPAMASLRSVHIIEGKHALSADLMVALVLKSGLAEYFQLIESTDKTCTFETHRKGAPKPTSLTYTIEEAEQAGLLKPTRSGKPSNWMKMQKIMLTHRAKSGLGRLVYPDVLAGLYTPEELRGAKGNGA